MSKFILLAWFILACSATQIRAAEKQLQVVVSFSILADMVKIVGGEDVLVTTMVGSDADAHVYQPTPENVKSLAKADLIFINGLGFEGWMQRLIQASDAKAPVIVASLGVTPRLMKYQAKEIIDPHAWQDISNGRIYVKNIALALAQAAPGRAASFRERAERYDAELAAEDKAIREQLAEIPLAQRKIIVSHDAFGYFGDVYGVTFLMPVGISTEAEASAANVARLIELIKTEGIKQVFIENMTNPKLIEQIGKDTGAQLGGTLYSDALSSAQGPAPTYVLMFRNNVPKFKAALLMKQKNP